jgi:hypothetical protein
VLTHLVVLGDSPVPALVLLALTLALLALRRDQATRLATTVLGRPG